MTLRIREEYIFRSPFSPYRDDDCVVVASGYVDWRAIHLSEVKIYQSRLLNRTSPSRTNRRCGTPNVRGTNQGGWLYVTLTVSDSQADFSEADRITTVRGRESELLFGHASGIADSAVSGHDLRAHFGTRQVMPRVADIDESTDGRNRREQKGGKRCFGHEQERRPRGRERLGRSSSQRDGILSKHRHRRYGLPRKGNGRTSAIRHVELFHSSLPALCRRFITPFA